MTFNKKIITGGAVLLVTGLIILGFMLFTKQEPETVSQEEVSRIKRELISTALVRTSTGVSVLLANKDYSILYAEKEDEFRLVVNEEIFGPQKIAVEKTFLSLVEENVPIACTLNVTIISKQKISQESFGATAPLSFCENFK